MASVSESPITLLRKSAETLREIFQTLAHRQPDRELETFFVRTSAEYQLLDLGWEHVNQSTVDTNFIDEILRLLESIITVEPSLRRMTAGHGLHDLNSRWTMWKGTSNRDEAKAVFANRCLIVGTAQWTPEYRLIYYDCLKSLRKRTDLEGSKGITRAVRNPPTAMEEEQFDDICSAARSTFEALAACKACSCESKHDFQARLRLATTYTNRGDHAASNRSFTFEAFLSTNKMWKEARIQTTDDMAGSFEIINANTTFPAGPFPEEIKQLCNNVERLSSLRRLELRVENSKLYELPDVEGSSNEVFDKSKVSWSLEAILKSRPFSEKSKRILAVIISSAVLHLHDSLWLHKSWKSSDVVFFQTASSSVPLRPFLETRISDLDPQGFMIDEGYEELSPQGDFGPCGETTKRRDDIPPHQSPVLITLAIILMEIFLNKSFEKMSAFCAQNRGAQDDAGTIPKRFLIARQVYQQHGHEISDAFSLAIKNCLEAHLWEDEHQERLKGKSLQLRIYRYIVLPLRTELEHSYAQVPLSNLDELAGTLDLMNWGQPILSKVAFDHQQEHSDQHFFFDGLAIKATPDGVAQILRKEYEKWRKAYQDVYSKFITHEPSTASEPPKVKIAILDTGIDKKHPGAPELIKKVRNWMYKATQDAHDTNGHGTATGCLLYEYAPDAEFYIAKVSDAEPASPEIIAQAIIHAVDKWNVDIISMSFGYPTNQNQGYQKLRDSIDHASSKHVLLFAAASNNGRNSGIAFPAREEKVIAVRATNNWGRLCSFSPTPCRGTVNLATMGKAVSVASLGNCPAHEIRSGTSYATPIVAGMAAFLLLYTRKKMPDLESRVKDPRIMKLLFQEVARVGNVSSDDYDYVYMSLSQDRLFGKEEKYVEDRIRDILNHG